MNSLVETLWKGFTRLHVSSYRLLKGRFVGWHTILVTTVGRKSGMKRTRPLLSLKDGNAYVLIASYYGSPKHPDWYLNLNANPTVTVEDHAHVLTCIASTVNDEAEYQRLWQYMCTVYPPYNSYKKRITRTIPIVRLVPSNT